MTPTSKGHYQECENCKHKTKSNSDIKSQKYPCDYSHSVIRSNYLNECWMYESNIRVGDRKCLKF